MEQTYAQPASGKANGTHARVGRARSSKKPTISHEVPKHNGSHGLSAAEKFAPSQVLHFQQTLGNRAVGRLIQAKLTISHPDDPYEREADRVADTVMRMAEPEATEEEGTQVQAKPLADRITPLVQRMPEQVHDYEERNTIAAKPLVQLRRVAVREDGEEEKVASEVEPGADLHEEGQEKAIQAKLEIGTAIQRQTKEDEEKETLQSTLSLQRQTEQEDEEAVHTKPLSQITPLSQCISEQVRDDEEGDTVAPKPLVQLRRVPVAVQEDGEEEKVAPKLEPGLELQEAEREKAIQGKLATGIPIQRQTMGDDEKEEEAFPSATSIQRQLEEENEETVQAKSLSGSLSKIPRISPICTASSTPSVQLLCAECEDEVAQPKPFDKKLIGLKQPPVSQEGRKLLAHELTHVVQRDGEQMQRARMQEPERAATTDAVQEQAAPVQEPRDESLELSESDPGAQPTSVMVGGGGSGEGARDSGGGSGDQPSAVSPERQAAAIIADSARSERQVNAVAAARRGEISARFGAVRRRITGLLASSSAGIQKFLTARQAEVQATTASVLTAAQAMLAGTVKAAQGQIQQARTVLDGVAGSATADLEGQVSQTAGRIIGLVDGLPLPDLPGVSAIRAGARALAGRAASAVTATLGQVRGLVGAALQRGAGLLGSLLSSVSQAASSALNRIGSMIQAAVRSVFAGLSRIGTALLNGLRRALDGTVLAGLRRVESTLGNNLATSKRQAITALHANRDVHLQALRDGRGAADGSPNLAAEARQNNVAVVTTFRERVTGLLGSIFDAIGVGASALSQHLGQLVSRVIAVVQAPLTQILTGLRQVGQAVSGFLQSLLSDLAAGITSVVDFVRSLIQHPLDAVMNFATRAVSKAGQFFAGLPSRLLGGNFNLPGVTELIGDPRASGPIIKPPPGPIVKPILTFLSLLFLAVGAIVLYFAPSLVAAVAAALAAFGITVAPVTLLIIVGVVAVAALIAALVLLYLLYRLIKPSPKPPPPVITHLTDFSAPDGSPKSRDEVGVAERVVFTGSAAGTWTASAGSPRRGTGPTFAWVAPERRRSVTIRLVVGRGTATAKLSVSEPNSIVAHKLSDQKPTPGKFGAGMFLDFEFHPLRVSFGNAATREVEGPASAIVGYYKRFGKKFLRHNPGPVRFFPIAENNRFAGGARDDASWLDQPPPFSDGSFHWKIPNKFRVVTESGDGKRYTTVIQEFGMEASGKARVDKAGEHTEHP